MATLNRLPKQIDVEMALGDTLVLTIQFYDRTGSGRRKVPHVGSTWQGQIKTAPTDLAALGTFDFDTADEDTGKIIASLDKVVTEVLSVDTPYYYDIQETEASSTRTTRIGGTVTLRQDTTRIP